MESLLGNSVFQKPLLCFFYPCKPKIRKDLKKKKNLCKQFHIIFIFFLAILVKLNGNIPFWLVICDVS